MKSIIRDIKENCPACECSIEETVKFLSTQGDIHYTSDHYREVWYSYTELLKMLKNKSQARNTTLELYKIKLEKFKYIQKWAKRVSAFT